MAIYDPQRDQEDPIATKRRQVIVSSLNTGAPAPVMPAGPSYPAPTAPSPMTIPSEKSWSNYNPYRQDPASPGYTPPGTGSNLPAPQVQQPAAPVPTAQQSPIVDRFTQWYGRPPTAAEFADFDRQSKLFAGAQDNVLQNLYRNSPAYNPQTPQYQQWQPAAPAATAQSGGYDYNALRDYIQGQGGALQTRAQLEALLSARPDIAQGVTITGAGDQLLLPSGDIIDAIFAMGDPSQARAAWTGVGGGAGGGGSVPSAGSTAATLPNAAGTPTAAAGGSGGATSGFAKSIRDQILKLLGMDLSNLDQNPAIQAQSQAYERSQQRAAEEARAAIAERLNAQGLGGTGGGGALDTQLERLRQVQGEQGASFNANLLANEINAIRNMGIQALQTGAGVMTADQEDALRRWLANLQNQQFGQDLDYRYSALSSGNENFLDQLGYNYTALQQQANRDALLAALGY